MQPAPETTPPQTDVPTEWVALHLPMLGEMAQLGMRLARVLTEQAERLAAEGKLVDAAAAANGFARVSRALRQTVLVGSKLAADQQKLEEERRQRMARAAGARPPLSRGQIAARKLGQRDHMAMLLPKMLERAAAEASEEAASDLQWATDLTIRVRNLEYDPTANDPSVAETIGRISRSAGVPFDPLVWDGVVPDTGELHPSVAATIAHQQRKARETRQDRDLDRLVNILEYPDYYGKTKEDIEPADERLSEVLERMESPDYDPLIGDRSIAELVEEISRTLGAPFDPDVWQEQEPQVEIKGELRPLSWPSTRQNAMIAEALRSNPNREKFG